jgi:hypothetical protein
VSPQFTIKIPRSGNSHSYIKEAEDRKKEGHGRNQSPSKMGKRMREVK